LTFVVSCGRSDSLIVRATAAPLLTNEARDASVRHVRLLRPALCALVLVGCGQAALTAEEERTVAEARYRFARVVLNGGGYGKALDSVDRVIAIYRDKPDAEYDGQPLKDVLRDAASDLDAYQPDMAAELDRATAE
jgi:hypothetical protein